MPKRQRIRYKKRSKPIVSQKPVKQQAPETHTQESHEPQIDIDNLTPDSILYLQRTIGNTATHQLVQHRAQSGTVQRGLFSKIKSMLGIESEQEETKQPEISAPTGGHTMTKEEQGDVPSMKELMAQKAEDDAIAELMGIAEDLFVKLQGLSDDVADGVADFFTAVEITTNAQEVADPDFMVEHQSRFILPRANFRIRQNGAWSSETMFYDDDGHHTLNVQGSNNTWYWGKLDDDTVAAVRKNRTTTASYEDVDPDTPLFPKGSPNPADVEQGGIGDCYLMAALSSVAQQDPAYIREIMVDQGDKVSVRLYEVDQSDPANHTFSPKYITIEKSIASLGGKALYNQGALWVSMMEKAYAAGGFTGSGTAPTQAQPSYEDISGGFSRHAFEVLMGEEARSSSLQGGPAMQSNFNFAMIEQTGWEGNTYHFNRNYVSLPWDQASFDMYNQLKAGPQPDDYTPLPFFDPVFNSNKGMVDTWMNFVRTGKIDRMFKKQNDEHAAGYAYEITIQSFRDLFQKEGLDNATANAVLTYIEANKLYPGELGTAVYSQSQLDSFEEVRTALTNGQSVAANTYQFPTRGNTGAGHSAGEATYQGIAGGHAYTVMDTKANTDSNPESDAGSGNFYWVKMRNPWGSYGREYDFSQVGPDNMAKAIEEGDGVFWLELSDLSRYFDSLDFSG